MAGCLCPFWNTAAAQGAEEQEAAAPAVEETEESEQPQTEAPEQEPKTDRDAQFAAARRKAEAERDAAIAQAKEDAQKQVDEFFKNSGLMNPYTGQPITTRAEYEAYPHLHQHGREGNGLHRGRHHPRAAGAARYDV